MATEKFARIKCDQELPFLLIHQIKMMQIFFLKNALTILYTLQSSVDFEKDLNVAKSLFQVYEYTRINLIEEFKSCKVNKSINALTALTEIRDSWKSIS